MDEEDWSSDEDAEITRGRKRAAASEGSEVRPARASQPRDWPPDYPKKFLRSRRAEPADPRLSMRPHDADR